jgi:hypothetical protein
MIYNLNSGKCSGVVKQFPLKWQIPLMKSILVWLAVGVAIFILTSHADIRHFIVAGLVGALFGVNTYFYTYKKETFKDLYELGVDGMLVPVDLRTQEYIANVSARISLKHVGWAIRPAWESTFVWDRVENRSMSSIKDTATGHTYLLHPESFDAMLRSFTPEDQIHVELVFDAGFCFVRILPWK